MIYFIFALLSIVLSAIEGVSYAGYVYVHIGFNPMIVYMASLVLAPFAKPLPKKLHTLLYTATGVSLICFMIIIFGEAITYPNFIFSHLHINPYTIMPVIVLLVFHVSILTNISIVKSFLLSCLIYLAVSGGGKTLGLIGQTFIAITKDPFASYSDKMTKAFPGFYPVIQTIKTLTPDDATILIPPQGNPWETEGNAAMVTYFLYPRRVGNLDQDTINELGDNTYLMISKGSWKRIGEVDYGWPKVGVPALKLWEIGKNGEIVNTYIRDYNPNTDAWDWGLIEVKHE